MTCARPRCNATPSKHFLHTSQYTLHTPHFTLHTCTSHSTLHLLSNHLSSSHLISTLLTSSHLLTCHLCKFFSTVFISSEHWPTFLISSKFVSTHLCCSARQKALTVREKYLAQQKHWAQKACAHRGLRHRTNAFTQKSLPKILNRNCCTQEVPFIAACSHFTRKNARFRAPASFICSHYHVAIAMCFAAPRTHPCSHYNAIRIPALQNTKGEPITRWNDPNRSRRTHKVPFIESHATVMQQLQCVFAAVLFCDVLLCDVLFCYVMYCYLMHCHVMYGYVMYCDVMYWCIVKRYIVMWCIVTRCLVMWNKYCNVMYC